MNCPENTISPLTGGILYPSVTNFTDAIYTAEFPEGRITDAQIKYGNNADAVSDIDLRWLIQRKQQQDPTVEIPLDSRERTHLYLAEVARIAELQCKQPGDKLDIDRHHLHELFPEGEYIGTPLSYTDISLVRHAAGYVLTHLGGGHAGSRLTDGSGFNATPLLSGIKGHFAAERDSSEPVARLPLRGILKAVAQSAETAGFGFQDEVYGIMSELEVPSRRDEFDNYSFIVRYPDDALPDTLSYRPEFSWLDLRLVSLAARTSVESHEQISGREGLTKIITLQRDPRSRIDDEGVATYVVKDEFADARGEDSPGISFSMKPQHPPVHELNASTNARIEEAVKYLSAQTF